jgi:hypothetical protein
MSTDAPTFEGAVAVSSETEATFDASSSMTGAASSASSATSALRANIEKNGKLSYYFAHANTPKEANISFHGPPKRLEGDDAAKAEPSGPAVRRVAIGKYGWADGTKAVSVYVDFEGLESLPEDACQVTSDATSFELTITKSSEDGKQETRHVLKLGPLSDEITGATIKRKPASLVLRLAKKEVGTWFELVKGASSS